MQISDDDIRVQLSLIKLGVVTDAELDYLMAKVLWLNKYVVWRNTRTNSKPILTITEDGEKFLSS
jgi:hypothetical protein